MGCWMAGSGGELRSRREPDTEPSSRHCPLPRPPLSERPADRLSVNAGKANSRCVEQRRHLPESLPWGPARCHNEASPPPPGEPHTCGCNAMTEISGFITMLVASSIHICIVCRLVKCEVFVISLRVSHENMKNNKI